MADVSTNFIGSVPEYYDKGLVPAIFEDYADLLTKQIVALKPARVLELAAGTGVVSQKLRAALPKETELVVSDLNEPMLAVARTKLKDAAKTTIQPLDAMALAFEDNSLDAIACQFGVMFFPDKVASYKEAHRTLKPGGRYIFNLWDAKSENPFSQIAQKLSEEAFPDDPLTFYNVPFHYHDRDQIHDDVKAAGFSEVEVETVRLKKTVADLEGFSEAIVRGNPICEEIENRGGDPKAFQSQVYDAYRQAFGDNPSVMDLSAIFVTATK